MSKVIYKIFKTISSALFIALVVIIVLILFYVVQVHIYTASGRVGEIKTNFYTILTQSMYPNIKAGDIVVTHSNDDDIYNTGDVITFISTSPSSYGLTITHRIVEVYELNGVYSYKTQGDNNNVADNSLIEASNVLGKVILKVPKAGYVQQFLVTKTGWVVAIVLPCMGIIIYDIMKVIKSLAKKKKEKDKNSNKVTKDILYDHLIQDDVSIDSYDGKNPGEHLDKDSKMAYGEIRKNNIPEREVDKDELQ